MREHVDHEKRVDQYAVDKNIEDFEKQFQYGSDEESIFEEF